MCRRRSVAASVVLVVGLLLLASAAHAGPKKADPEELFNPLLGVEWSHWLVGPVSWIATKKEIEEFLLLVTDEEAAAFAEEFWAERSQDVGPFEKGPREIFRERAETADSRYTEGAWPGRRTDRGTVYVVHGEPESIEFESPERVGDPPQEVWVYGKDAEKGLDGEKPDKRYRFFERRDGRTVFWDHRARMDPRDRLRREDEQRRRGGGFG